MRFFRQPISIILLLLSFSACGGGTTGTSPSGNLRLQGSIFTNTGLAVANTPMNVLPDKETNSTTTATTDQTGAFDMNLSGDVSRFSIEINDHRSPPFERAYQAASIISALVVQGQNGQLSLPSVVEAQVDNNRNCPQIVAEDNTLVIANDSIHSNCFIPLNINFTQSTKIEYHAMIKGLCNNQETIFTQLPISHSGLWEIQLPNNIPSNCIQESLSIESDDQLHQITFPILFSD